MFLPCGPLRQFLTSLTLLTLVTRGNCNEVNLLRFNMYTASNSISHGYPTLSYFKVRILNDIFSKRGKFKMFFSVSMFIYIDIGHGFPFGVSSLPP